MTPRTFEISAAYRADRRPDPAPIHIQHFARALRCDMPELRQMAAYCVEQHGALTDQEIRFIAPQGPHRIRELVREVQTAEDARLPNIALDALCVLARQLESLTIQIREIERRLLAWHRADEASQRLENIPGIGFITATVLSASVPDPAIFKSGRQFAAFLGLAPRQNSSGGKERLGRISKMGDGYLRRLLVVGATSVIRRVASNRTTTGAWVRSLLERKPARVATFAMANKTA